MSKKPQTLFEVYSEKKMEIYCRYRDFGYVATSPQAPGQSTQHFSGPRGAAEKLADSVFGKGAYILTRNSYKIYEAVPKSTETVPK